MRMKLDGIILVNQGKVITDGKSFIPLQLFQYSEYDIRHQDPTRNRGPNPELAVPPRGLLPVRLRER